MVKHKTELESTTNTESSNVVAYHAAKHMKKHKRGKNANKNKKSKKDGKNIENNIQNLLKEVEDTEKIMKCNVKLLVDERETELDKMLAASQDLEEAADKFQIQAKNTKRKYWCKFLCPCCYFCFECCCSR